MANSFQFQIARKQSIIRSTLPRIRESIGTWWLTAATFSSTLPHGLMVLGFAITAAAGFFSAVMNRIDCCPSATLSFFFGHTALLVTFFDVSCLTFFFVRIFVFVTSWHSCFLLLI